jgi:hypothetical protein
MKAESNFFLLREAAAEVGGDRGLSLGRDAANGL